MEIKIMVVGLFLTFFITVPLLYILKYLFAGIKQGHRNYLNTKNNRGGNK